MNQISKPAGIAAALIVFSAIAASNASGQEAASELGRIGQENARQHESILKILKSIRDEESFEASEELPSMVEQLASLRQEMTAAYGDLPETVAERIVKPYVTNMLRIIEQERNEIRRIRAIGLPGAEERLAQLESQCDEVARKWGGEGGSSSAFSISSSTWSFLFPVLLLMIFMFCVGFCYREGTWGNAITLVNLIVAALVAVNFWEPLARMLESKVPLLTFMYDRLALWGVFSLCYLILSLITRMVSRTNVRFRELHDQIGGVVLAAVIGCVMVSFTTMTLHTAPLAKNFLFGGFRPESRMLFGLAPDRQWLGFVKRTSTGSLARWTPREFDPENQFIEDYAQRREKFEDYSKERQGFTVAKEDFGSKIPER